MEQQADPISLFCHLLGCSSQACQCICQEKGWKVLQEQGFGETITSIFLLPESFLVFLFFCLTGHFVDNYVFKVKDIFIATPFLLFIITFITCQILSG